MKKLMILSFIFSFYSIMAFSQMKEAKSGIIYNEKTGNEKSEKKSVLKNPDVSADDFEPFEKGNFEVAFTGNLVTGKMVSEVYYRYYKEKYTTTYSYANFL